MWLPPLCRTGFLCGGPRDIETNWGPACPKTKWTPPSPSSRLAFPTPYAAQSPFHPPSVPTLPAPGPSDTDMRPQGRGQGPRVRSDLRFQELRVAAGAAVPGESDPGRSGSSVTGTFLPRVTTEAQDPPIPRIFLSNICSFESYKYLLVYLAFS